MKLFSPAKINLFLRIVGKRLDGYHELASLFQVIDLGDTLTIEAADHDHLTCTDPTIPTDEKNLVIKATQLFRRKTGLKIGLKVHLDKKIPYEAGLGGGSSNAATALWAINQLAGNIATHEELKTWSAEIGSDITFFLSQGTAYCTGRGENVRHLSPLVARTLWIVKPPIGLSTPEVYRTLGLKPTHLPPESEIAADLNKFIANGNHFFNDLEKPAFQLRPELKLLKDELQHSGFDTVLMTGSGSAFFCIGEGTPPLRPDLFCVKARFLNRSPINWYEKDNHGIS